MNGKLFEEYLEGLKEAIRADLQEVLFKNKTFQEKYLEYIESKIKSVKGVKKVQRIVCGGCLDFKVITSLDAASFGAWAEAGFGPEAEVLEAWRKIPNVSAVETQTYTIMDV